MPSARLPKDRSTIENAYLKEAANRLRQNPRDLDALEAVGAYFLAHDKADEALECFHRITRIDPAYPGIWRLKAKAFEAVGDRDSADQCRRRGADRQS